MGVNYDSEIRQLKYGKVDKPQSPSDGDTLVYNATTASWEAGSLSFDTIGKGYALNGFSGLAATLTDAATIYWGGIASAAPGSTGGAQRLYIPKSGTIKAVYAWGQAGTAGSNEAWSSYIRLNDTTDTLIQALSSTSTYRVWSNQDLSIAVSVGDYIEIKMVNPTWATNPANMYFGASIYLSTDEQDVGTTMGGTPMGMLLTLTYAA
jgi:hypothetical protein